MKKATWLEVAILFTGLCGVSTVLAAGLAPEVLESVLGALFVPAGAPDLSPSGRLAAGIAGAAMMGWGTTLWVLVRHLHALHAGVVGRAFSFGIGVWFIADCLTSLIVGAYVNLPGNLVFLLVALPPAWLLAREGRPGVLLPASDSQPAGPVSELSQSGR